MGAKSVVKLWDERQQECQGMKELTESWSVQIRIGTKAGKATHVIGIKSNSKNGQKLR